MMINLFRASPSIVAAQRFRAVILEMLDLPAGADERELRAVMIGRGVDILEWYENRVSEIEENTVGHRKVRRAAHRRVASPRAGHRTRL
jgi:hypothetical protein